MNLENSAANLANSGVTDRSIIPNAITINPINPLIESKTAKVCGIFWDILFTKGSKKIYNKVVINMASCKIKCRRA